MKKLFLLLTIIILLTGCSDPSSERSFDPIDDEPVHEIVGTWIRSGNAFDFYTNGDFIYYEFLSGSVLNEGWYDIEDDLIHIQDRDDGGAVQNYIFEIIQDEPEIDETTLRWSTVGSPLLTVDWMRVVE